MKKMAQEFYKAIFSGVTDRQFLRSIKISKKQMLKMLKREHFLDHLERITDSKEISCVDVFNMCENIMEELSIAPEKGWLNWTYQYLLNKSFHHMHEDIQIAEHVKGVLFYLKTFKILLAQEKRISTFSFKRDFELLHSEELSLFTSKEEYKTFIDIYEDTYIYELMRIGREITRFNILSHIAGVHYVAMHVARQLYHAGLPIDLGIVSGAALGHDIGKFGCRDKESGRVPYLHYYYTDFWFKKYDMPVIGHVAANHSAWDLELENLPVESLVLIYSDFRVKNKFKYAHEYDQIPSKETIEFFSLKQSFDVILNKLDDVDETKRNRYVNVYNKLHDFEKYIESIGVNTDLTSSHFQPIEAMDSALLTSTDAINRLKYYAVNHNIVLMSKISDDKSVSNVLEVARSEKNWKNIRSYINIFEEYFTYTTQKQKLLVLSFLYELLMHREGDIRRQAADLMGNIITHFDEKYRKELPTDVSLLENEIDSKILWNKYLNLVINPDHKISDQHRRWVGYALKIFVRSALEKCNLEEKGEYVNTLVAYYKTINSVDDLTAFVLADAMNYIPLEYCSTKVRKKLLDSALALLKRDSLEIQVGALDFIKYYTSEVLETEINCSQICQALENLDKEGKMAITYLVQKVLKNVGYCKEEVELCTKITDDHENVMSEAFLNNLKVATPWIVKVVNIEVLEALLKKDPRSALHVATHFSNLIKVSERVAVRHKAGKALIRIAHFLSPEQCNEIAIELTKGLEMGEYQFSKYIPEYLGELVLFLPPKELDEIISHLSSLFESSNDRVASVTLITLGVLINNYEKYKRFNEDSKAYSDRLRNVLGIIVSGLANYNEPVQQEAFLVIGKDIFGSTQIEDKDKQRVFRLIYRKLLLQITEKEKSELSFFNNAASLNHIYRFISNYEFKYGEFNFTDSRKVAFFPGTFDPFSLSHKAIAREIKNQGYTLYLALDEFSWSKKTQPRMIRRDIINMSIADQFHIYLFPDNISINLANENDIEKLRNLFPDKDIYLVMGSDVVLNASAYKCAITERSVHNMNHIVFSRKSLLSESGEQDVKIIKEKVRGDLEMLSLPMHLEDISSTQIRDHIDYNRDISNLIDPLAQNFIYDFGLYLRESQYKTILKTRAIHFEMYKKNRVKVINEIFETVLTNSNKDIELKNSIIRIENGKDDFNILVMRDEENNNRILGFSIFQSTTTSELYKKTESTILADYVRSKTSGKIAMISCVYINNSTKQKNVAELILTETVTNCIEKDFTYALYFPMLGAENTEIQRLMDRQGFIETKCVDIDGSAFTVDMSAPITCIQNVEFTIKEPLNRRDKVLEAIDSSNKRLQDALIKMYSGELVISFESGLIQHGIAKKVTEINRVSSELTNDRTVGPYMCVPFSKLLKGMAVPNTVTKTLHTEKIFDPEIREFSIKEYPFYSSLDNQIKTIKSFNRPVILVDDILHKGYRIKELDSMFKANGIEIKKMIVGILSGHGKDLMQIQGRDADSVYYIPNLRAWFVDTGLYPFIGGDSVVRERAVKSSLLPSVNLILPYIFPSFMTDIAQDIIYNFSMTCLINAKEIFTALEKEYRDTFERNLTLNRLSEVMMFPRYPDIGQSINYDYNLPPSVYIDNDIERLIRLRDII